MIRLIDCDCRCCCCECWLDVKKKKNNPTTHNDCGSFGAQQVRGFGGAPQFTYPFSKVAHLWGSFDCVSQSPLSSCICSRFELLAGVILILTTILSVHRWHHGHDCVFTFPPCVSFHVIIMLYALVVDTAIARRQQVEVGSSISHNSQKFQVSNVFVQENEAFWMDSDTARSPRPSLCGPRICGDNSVHSVGTIAMAQHLYGRNANVS